MDSIIFEVGEKQMAIKDASRNVVLKLNEVIGLSFRYLDDVIGELGINKKIADDVVLKLNQAGLLQVDDADGKIVRLTEMGRREAKKFNEKRGGI